MRCHGVVRQLPDEDGSPTVVIETGRTLRFLEPGWWGHNHPEAARRSQAKTNPHFLPRPPAPYTKRQ